MKGFYICNLFECPPFELFAANDCPRAVDILEDKFFEPQSMKIWCELARTATSIIDIGAHVGVYALAAASLRKDIHIHAFEPNPDAFARLQLHKNINGFDHLRIRRDAIANDMTVAYLKWIDRGWISSGASLVQPHGNGVWVSTITLDTSGIKLGERPLIKIDVEGAERLVFEGMAESINSKPDIILESFDANQCADIWRTVEPLGYKAWFIDEYDGLIPRDTIMPANRKTKSFNHFLSVRYGETA